MSVEREVVDRGARLAVEELTAKLDGLRQEVYTLDSRIIQYHDVNKRTFNLLTQRDAEDARRGALRQIEEDGRWFWTRILLGAIIGLVAIAVAMGAGAALVLSWVSA